MTLTIAKFEEVHTLVSPEDWPAIRKNLLDHVVKYDTTLPGAAITTKDQMELLLREGMWKEALTIIPGPPGVDSDYANRADNYVEMLELLWFELERISSDNLKKVLEVIEEFAKKEFQQYRIRSLDRLLDSVQVYFPKFILALYKAGSDILLADLPAKHYKLYCDFCLALKTRLVDLRKNSDWQEFITEVRRKNARKTKLIRQMDISELK